LASNDCSSFPFDLEAAKSLGLLVEESTEITEARDKWRKYVQGVANLRIEDG